jgi:hypothetical protein
MKTLNRKVFTELANTHNGKCVSLFLPTHKAGEEVLNREDQIRYKNLLKELEVELIDQGLQKMELDQFMNPARDLLEDGNFWRKQEAGLAVFFNRDILKTFSLPISFEPFFYLSHEFYLKPLIPLFNETYDFFLLALNLKDVKLYRGDHQGLKEVELEEPLPKRIEEVVGADYEQKVLAYHGQRSGHAEAIYHGHGEGKDDKREEVLAYFRAIDKAIAPVLKNEQIPLLVAALDHQFALYQKVNSYSNLLSEHLSGNPKARLSNGLFKEAFQLLRSKGIEKVREEKADLYHQFHYTGRTSTELKDAIPAALGGRVDTLFLDEQFEAFGIYDKRDSQVHIHNRQSLSNTSLTNLLALTVFQNGGTVFLEKRDQLPFPETPLNVLYRY